MFLFLVAFSDSQEISKDEFLQTICPKVLMWKFSLQEVPQVDGLCEAIQNKENGNIQVGKLLELTHRALLPPSQKTEKEEVTNNSPEHFLKTVLARSAYADIKKIPE